MKYIEPFEDGRIQLIPVNVLIIPTDNITRKIFDPTNDETEFEVDEGHGLKSTVKFLHKAGNFNQLDRLVYYAVISEIEAGNNVFSIRRLWRRIGGSHFLTPKMHKAIADSVEKMAQTRIEIDMTEVNEKRRYVDKKELKYRRNVLPEESLTAIINGQIIKDAISILKPPPIFNSTTDKKQFTSCDTVLLDVPGLKNTETTLKIKGYLLCRTVEIIGSNKKNVKHFAGRTKGGKLKFVTNKKLQDRILLKHLLEQCELDDFDRGKTRDVRNVITKILNHFKENGLISDWSFEKENRKIQAIKLTF